MLTLLLIPEIEKTGGRVINLTSSLHHLAKKFDFDDIMSEMRYEMFTTYAQSKLANILFTRELQKRLKVKNSPVCCFAVHPGLVRTEVTRNMKWWIQLGNQIAYPIMITLQKTPEQGAYCTLYAATNEEITKNPEYRGQYFVNSTLTKTSAAAENMEAAKKLWDLSLKLTGLSNVDL
jgi:retinol dehydrogenase 12